MKQQSKMLLLMARNTALWIGQWVLIGFAVLVSAGFVALLCSLGSHLS